MFRVSPVSERLEQFLPSRMLYFPVSEDTHYVKQTLIDTLSVLFLFPFLAIITKYHPLFSHLLRGRQSILYSRLLIFLYC